MRGDPLQDRTSGYTFWADAVAQAIVDSDPAEPIVIKGGVSPSGVAHLGNFNEIMRGYFVASVLRDRGFEVKQIFTSDDRDPLRKLPKKLADRDGEIVGLGEVNAGALGRNLGKPYTDIPDPFGEAQSYAAHFANLLKADAERLDVPVEMVSNTKLYENGDFDTIIEAVLRRRDTARELLSEYQESVDETYVPFNPICASCGKITETVTDVNPDAGTVTYTCTDLNIASSTIEGCGHEGSATFREGKLPWRFEWPAQWNVLDVDHEPFGKDHAEGSWPSGKAITETIFESGPPLPMVYEWFTLNGDALSSSEGNVVTVPEILELLEPAVLRYFFIRNPRRARDLDLSRLDQLVDEFDRFEAAYFGKVEDSAVTAFAERAYPYVVDEVRPNRIRLPYTFAAILGMTESRELRLEMARSEGHIDDDTPQWAINDALSRVDRAQKWARRMDNGYNYRLQNTCPAVTISPQEEEALNSLAEYIAAGHTGKEIQSEIYDIARQHGIEVARFFELGYRLFFDQTQGPRLGEFLGDLEQSFVVSRLRREG